MDDRDLEAFLATHALAGEVIRLQAHTPTVETAAHLGVSRKRVKLADAASVQAFTGYPVGAVPPFGHPGPLPTLIDRRVLAQPQAAGAGGGAGDALLRIAPAEIVRAAQAQTVDVIVED